MTRGLSSDTPQSLRFFVAGNNNKNKGNKNELVTQVCSFWGETSASGPVAISLCLGQHESLEPSKHVKEMPALEGNMPMQLNGRFTQESICQS